MFVYLCVAKPGYANCDELLIKINTLHKIARKVHIGRYLPIVKKEENTFFVKKKESPLVNLPIGLLPIGLLPIGLLPLVIPQRPCQGGAA